MPGQSKPEEAVMAGDGGRAPDVSEQRAEVEAMRDRLTLVEGRLAAIRQTLNEVGAPTHSNGSKLNENGRLVDLLASLTSAPAATRDPASVLAALLAEQPDATVAALEALLTSDESERAAGDYFAVAKAPTIEGILSAACRSLRPKAPKEDRDA